LIYREEQISHKTFERYKNRPDKLIYRSVTYSEKLYDFSSGDSIIKDNNLDKEIKVKKMTQKFELDPSKPAEEQKRKTVFNLETDEIVIYYHFKEGQIFRKPSHYDRNVLRNSGNQGDMNEKDQGDESK
jgi:hypothetical protein